MSSSLVRQSLGLFDDDGGSATVSSSGKEKKTKDPMKLISTRKKGVKRELRKIQKQERKTSVGKGKKSISGLEQYREQLPEDYTQASVEALRKLSESCKTEASVSKVILAHHKQSLSKSKRTKEEKSKTTEQTSVFSDTDFNIFEKEYDFSK